MGEQQLDVVTSDTLHYVPVSEFVRLRGAGLNPVDYARAFAALARINTLYMIAQAWSGHIGTSFSSLDIMSWIFLNELRDLDKGPDECDLFFSSKGHDAPALYSVLIALGMLDEEKLHALRRLHGLPGHPHVETPYIQANTGSLGMGVSKAKGMVIADRLRGRSRRVFVLAGDGELQEGQFWESLPSAVHLGLHEIVVVIDRNKIQSDTWVKDVNDLGDLEAKLEAFGWHVERVDGHDAGALQALFRRLDQVKTQPKVVIADTVKGKGVSFMEGPAMRPGDLYQYHSGAPNEDEYARGSQELIDAAQTLLERHHLAPLRLVARARAPRKPVLAVQRLVAAYSRALVDQAGRNPRIVALDADLVKDCGLIEFREKFPDRFVECGIAEQDMVSMACGMAHRGALPVVHSFACFLSARPNEQIYNQASESTSRRVRGFPGRSASRRARSLASVRSRYLGGGRRAEVDCGRAVHRTRGRVARGFSVQPCGRERVSPPGFARMACALRVAARLPSRIGPRRRRPRGTRRRGVRIWTVAPGQRVGSCRTARETRYPDSPGQSAVAESGGSVMAARGSRFDARGLRPRQPLPARWSGRDAGARRLAAWGSANRFT